MAGTECCGAWIITRTHHSPSWHCCAHCGSYVTLSGKYVAPADGNSVTHASYTDCGGATCTNVGSQCDACAEKLGGCVKVALSTGGEPGAVPQTEPQPPG